ncbi:MAG TPA: RNA methyltransferase [Ohtaekwangia sp.]|uniref:TrmH family RNA methyltransferase n=1 Tax=Ohtaekwangia sp. TaxID=2066019 RepID=UPI002F92D7E5
MTDKEFKVLHHLSQFVSDHKKDFVEKVLGNRTHHVTVILEDIFQSQNASAVIRTCECMGLQDIHIIEMISKYEINRRVLKGANKWMELHRYRARDNNNVEECFSKLHAQGYKILVADPDEDGMSIHDVDVTESKVALLFGNELRGVSPYALQHADQKIKIPMYGFTESLNISVSVAICLNALITKLHASAMDFGLQEEEKNMIRLNWYRKIVKRSDLIEREYLRTIQ